MFPALVSLLLLAAVWAADRVPADTLLPRSSLRVQVRTAMAQGQPSAYVQRLSQTKRDFLQAVQANQAQDWVVSVGNEAGGAPHSHLS